MRADALAARAALAGKQKADNRQIIFGRDVKGKNAETVSRLWQKMRGRKRMEVRKLELWEHEDSRRLYEEVFNEDSPSFVAYYYTEKTRDNQIYVAKEDGKIRSMLSIRIVCM